MSLVLCYHAVSPTWPAALSIEPDRFAGHLDTLLSRGYQPVTFSEAVTSPRTKSVAITFDDSFASVHERALPLLEGSAAVATVFVPTSFVGKDGPMAWPGTDNWLGTEHEEELRPMGWDQLTELAGKGWEIGSHTSTHPRLTELSPGPLADEMTASRESIEGNLGLPCRAIAYPYGDHDDEVTAAALAAGYSAGATLPKRFPRPKAIRWPRVGIYHRDDARRFALKISRPLLWARRTPSWGPVRARGDA